ncbi:MAG: DUF4834 family protein [Rikenellaceae bacterium]
MFNWIKDNPIFFFLLFLAIAAPTLFMGAMRVIFYIIIGVVVLMLILGLIFRVKIRKIQNDMYNNMSGGGRQAQGGSYSGSYQRTTRTTHTKSDEGDVKIFKQQGVGEKKISGDVGDYVEFEEIDEK